MIEKYRLLGMITPLLLTISPAFGFILNDSFDDGDRTIQNPPESVAYFTSQMSETLEEVDGILRFHGYSNRFFLAAVGEAGDYITLNDGEALSLEMTFRVEGKLVRDNKQLRMAWFNSGEKPGDDHLIYHDVFGSKSLIPSDFRGYQTAIELWSPLPTDDPIMILKRVKSGDDLIISIYGPASTYRKLGAGGVGQVDDDGLNTVQFYLRRVGQSLEVGTIFVPGGSASGNQTDFFYQVMDIEDPLFQFDYFAIGLNSADKSVERLDIESLRIFKVQ